MKSISKLALTASLVLAITFTFSLTACGGSGYDESDKIPKGSSWLVKAADGSRKVTLYKDEWANNVGTTIPDGTEVLELLKYREGIYSTKYKDTSYFISEKDLNTITETGKIAAAKKESDFKMRKLKEAVQAIVWLVIITVTFVMLFRWTKTRSLKVYQKYYAQKRQEFPWLDKWIQKNGDPSEKRAGTYSIESFGMAAAVFLVLVVITYFIGKSSNVNTLVYLGLAVCVNFLWAKKKSAKNAGDERPEAGLTLECPSCHCPHSWGMHRKEVIIEDATMTTTTTTRTGYGQGDIIDSAFEGFKQSGTTSKTKTTYYCRYIKDFECFNCGKTEHNEYEMKLNDAPKTGVFNYNPPKTAFEYKE
jgi:hypothetical protein